MDFLKDEPGAIKAKCFSIIEKQRAFLQKIDRWQFPSDRSEGARDLLLDAFGALARPSNLESVNPAVLYNRLFSLQQLVDTVDGSATDRISWPLVRYCDAIWSRLFGDEAPTLFYSLMAEHNYSIFSYTDRLAFHLQSLLPLAEIDSLINNRKIFCLRLASAEDENSPLYANIGHEFGHALFGLKQREILAILGDSLERVLSSVNRDLRSDHPRKASRLYRRLVFVYIAIAEELFCDLAGAVLMGPAFVLSLYEISWGQAKDVWPVRLEPVDRSIRAYPSFAFRLSCLMKLPSVESFISEAGEEFSRLPLARLRDLHTLLSSIPTESKSNTVKVYPPEEGDSDSEILGGLVRKYLGETQCALQQFTASIYESFLEWFDLQRNWVRPRDVGALLQRLHHNILPNIIPDGSLLGEPARFTAILNATAFYRLNLMTNDATERDMMMRQVAIAERLTAKAFESTFIQREFLHWSAKNGDTQ